MLAGRPERLGGPRDPVLRRPSLDRTAGGHGHRATGLRNKRGRRRGADGVRGLAGLGREGSNDVPAATACRCAARSRSPAPRGPSPMSTAIAIRCVSPISRTRTSRLGRPSTGGGVSQSSGPSRTRGAPLYPRRILPATRSGSPLSSLPTPAWWRSGSSAYRALPATRHAAPWGRAPDPVATARGGQMAPRLPPCAESRIFGLAGSGPGTRRGPARHGRGSPSSRPGSLAMGPTHGLAPPRRFPSPRGGGPGLLPNRYGKIGANPPHAPAFFPDCPR